MAFIYRLCRALDEAKVDYAIVGGYAVALHGVVRSTVDIDLAIRWDLDQLRVLEKVLRTLDLSPTQPIDANRLFFQRERLINEKNLVAWNFVNVDNPAENVDVVVNFDLSGRSTVTVETATGSVEILNLQDLIEMKERSGRPQDHADCEALRKLL